MFRALTRDSVAKFHEYTGTSTKSDLLKRLKQMEASDNAENAETVAKRRRVAASVCELIYCKFINERLDDTHACFAARTSCAARREWRSRHCQASSPSPAATSSRLVWR